MSKLKKHGLWLSLTVVAAAVAGFALPGSGVFATQPQPEGKAACADLTSEITAILGDVTSALVPPVTIPPALPDISKATGLVGKLTTTATNLVNLGCLPDPASAVKLPAADLPAAVDEKGKLPIPGIPVPSLSVLPSLPATPGLPGVPGTPAVDKCAAPAAGLLSLVFGLLESLLDLVGGTGVPDVTAVLGQVTGVQSTVTSLTTESCLPAPLPVRR